MYSSNPSHEHLCLDFENKGSDFMTTNITLSVRSANHKLIKSLFDSRQKKKTISLSPSTQLHTFSWITTSNKGNQIKTWNCRHLNKKFSASLAFRERQTWADKTKHSPQLRSLCCAVHSGPPGQLSVCRMWQNSTLGKQTETEERERERER